MLLALQRLGLILLFCLMTWSFPRKIAIISVEAEIKEIESSLADDRHQSKRLDVEKLFRGIHSTKLPPPSTRWPLPSDFKRQKNNSAVAELKKTHGGEPTSDESTTQEAPNAPSLTLRTSDVEGSASTTPNIFDHTWSVETTMLNTEETTAPSMRMTEATTSMTTRKPTTKPPPSCPANLQKLFFPERFITDSQMMAKWAFKCYKSGITYNVTYSKQGGDQADATVIVVETTKNVIITGLEAFTRYNVCVCAVVDEFQSDCNATCSSQTTEIGHPERPQNVTIVDVTTNSMRVAWNPPARVAGPTNYSVWLVSKENASLTVPDASDVTIFNLKAFTSYCVTVEAKTEKGTNSTAGPCQITNPDAPGRVRNLKALCGVTNCTASWQIPVAVNGLLEHYELSYFGIRRVNISSKNIHLKSISKKRRNDSRIISGNSTGPTVVVTLDGLLADSDYTFKVRAKTVDVAQLGEASSFKSKTDAGVPSTNYMDPVGMCDAGPNKKSQLKINLRKNMFKDDGGDICKYNVIVAEASKAETPQHGHGKGSPFHLWNQVKNRKKIIPYVTTPNNWNPFCEGNHRNCTWVAYVIGTDTSCFRSLKPAEPCNGPLRPGTTYSVQIRGYTSVGYADRQLCTFSTDSNSASVIVITFFGLLLFALFASAFMVCVHRKHIVFAFVKLKTPRKDHEKTGQQVGLPTITVSIPITAIAKPIPLADFVEHFKMMFSDSGLKFSQEFEELTVASATGSTKIAQLTENKSKNRWINILPFDDSRVKLLPIPDDVSTDYINASYIPGYRSPREYIATQGPLPTTKDDFWRMVWEQSSPMIVMVTQCVERGKIKCEEYWPTDREKHYFGDLAVRLKSESILSGFTIRILDLELGTRVMEVKQMHFTMWPDFGCPENTTLLLNFVRSVRDHIPRHDVGPVVVHCSAGVGRTGTFMAVDCLMQHVYQHDYVDVYGTVLNMRQHRVNMVQTEDQYVYIHECIKDLLLEPRSSKKCAKSDDPGCVEQVYTNLEDLQQESQNALML